MKDTILTLLLTILLTIFVLNAIMFVDNSVIMPRCQEDVVLVGVGQFENGRWDSYICGPALDSYVK